MDKSEKEIIWDAPEFEYQEKSGSWYWLTVIFALLVAVFSVGRGNFLFAFFVVIAEGMMIHWGRKKPKEIRFQIDDQGIHIGQKFYSYDDVLAFAVHNGEIILRLKSRLSTYVKIYTYGADIGRIKSFLSHHLTEFEYQESLIDHLGRIIRF